MTQHLKRLAQFAMLAGVLAAIPAVSVSSEQAPPVTVPGIDKPVVVVTGSVTETETWTSANYYVLRGAVFVRSGATLNIQAGTRVIGESGSVGTLIVERGGRLNAIGTRELPIVFTSDQPLGQRSRGDWGGIIINGRAPITAEDLGAAGAMAVLLKDALKPNLIQTLEGQPCLMHCGPFANIAHGNNSLVADLIGMKLGDYVVTESGFGSDMGAEKFFDIVCRSGGLAPSAAVLVTTVRAIKHHGGIEDDPRTDRARARAAIEGGMANVRRHLANIKQFGLPCVVAVNRRPGDTNEEIDLVKRLALEAGAYRAEANEGFTKGGIGAADLASAVVDACDESSEFRMLYEDDWTIQDKIEAIARRVYGAADVYFYPEAEKKIGQYTADGLDELPICMAKTHLSLSSDPELLNAPENFSLPVRDIRAYTGAGWLVPLCGDITQMPGLGKTPAALNVDIDENGRTVGLF